MRLALRVALAVRAALVELGALLAPVEQLELAESALQKRRA